MKPLFAPSVVPVTHTVRTSNTLADKRKAIQADPQLLSEAEAAIISRAKRNCQELLEASGYFHHSYPLASLFNDLWQKTIREEMKNLLNL